LVTKQNRMYRRIAHIALVVDDYDKAIQFYTEKLDFDLLEDTMVAQDKRWVIVASKGARECSLLLAKAANEEQLSRVGNQTGGRVSLFLFTDDFWRDYAMLTAKDIKFIRQPQDFEYGIVAVFEDLYGNLWDLVQPSEKNKGLI
jgi:catechol 2,3-dioxygenase-like lactoylglutathione lyase family enzyme